MAFDSSKLVHVTYAGGRHIYYYDADANSETLATVMGSGYIDNEDDAQNFAADDQVMVKATDGFTTLEVSAVSSGTVTFRDLGGRTLHTKTTSSDLQTGINLLTETTASTHYLPSAPAKGDYFRIVGTGVAGHAVSSTGSLSLGSTGATTLTLGGIGAGVELLAYTTTQYLVVGALPGTFISTTYFGASYVLS